MNTNAELFAIFAVTDVRDFGKTELFQSILPPHWNKQDCFYWLESGLIVVINPKEETKMMYAFLKESDKIEFTCLSSAMLHPVK